MSRRTRPYKNKQGSPLAPGSPLSPATSLSGYRNTSQNLSEDDEDDGKDGSYLENSGQENLDNISDNTLDLDVVGSASPRRVRRTVQKSPTGRSPRRNLRSVANTSGEFSSPETYKRLTRQPIHRGAATPDSAKKEKRASSPRQPRIEPQDEKSFLEIQNDPAMQKLAAGAAFVVLLLLWLLTHLLKSGYNTKVEMQVTTRERYVNKFEVGFKEVVETFPNQSQRFWKSIKATTKAVLKEEQPIRPGVTIMMVTEDAHQTASCIGGKVSNLISKAYGTRYQPVTLSHRSDDSRSAAQVKMDIDEALDTGFNAGSKVALINNLEQIPSLAAMMFHSYCDNDNASFKDNHIIFTVNVKNAPEDEHGADEVVERLLKQKWGSELEVDQFSALWSRIGNNVVLVRPESAQVLSTHCS